MRYCTRVYMMTVIAPLTYHDECWLDLHEIYPINIIFDDCERSIIILSSWQDEKARVESVHLRLLKIRFLMTSHALIGTANSKYDLRPKRVYQSPFAGSLKLNFRKFLPFNIFFC